MILSILRLENFYAFYASKLEMLEISWLSERNLGRVYLKQTCKQILIHGNFELIAASSEWLIEI